MKMKNLKLFKKAMILTMISVLTFPSIGFAQTRNYKHPNQTSIDSNGKIKKDGVEIGYISKGNEIFDAEGHKIAYTDGKGNLVDGAGKIMGRIGKDGKTFKNLNGDLLISVKDNGTTCEIFDAKGKKIGNVHSSYKGMACVLYCFNNNMNMENHSKVSATDKFACPMHPEITGKAGDKCSKCGMKLKKS